MSEPEKQAAIAKIKAQGCRRWMTILIIAPVFLCAALTLIAPTIRNYLARNEANQQCLSLSQGYEAVSIRSIFETSDFSGEALITADTIGQMVLLGETTLDPAPQHRDYLPAVSHPDATYAIYADYQAGYATKFFICDPQGAALGAFTGDETARDLIFNADASLFAVSEGRMGQVRIFDGDALRPIETITIRSDQDYRQIDSIAFHPTQALIFFTSAGELFVYETANFTEILRVPIVETVNHEIGFNADGTLFLMASLNTNTAYVWGVRE